MKLNALHQISTRDIMEGIDPSTHEKLAFVQMMVAKQGKDPEPIVNRIRGMLDPEFAKHEGAKTTFYKWLATAQREQTREGNIRIPGQNVSRKVRVTVLESVVRDLITEGFFSDIGAAILKKLKSVIDDEPQEREAVKAALDARPSELGWILRYAQNAEQPLQDDEKFWLQLDKTTGGLAKKIKAIVDSVHERIVEMRQTNPQATLFTECVIEEARLSAVMQDLGLEPTAVQSLMTDYGIRDEDYDLARLRDALTRAGGNVKAALQTAGSAVAGGLTGGITGGVRGAVAGVKKALDPRKNKQANLEYADKVISIAHALMSVEQAKQEATTSPAQAKQTLQQTAQDLGMETISPPAETEKPGVVSAADLQRFSPQG